MMTINLNQEILVHLTAQGQRILAMQPMHVQESLASGYKPCRGTLRIQLWMFCQIFGRYLFSSCEVPTEGNNIELLSTGAANPERNDDSITPAQYLDAHAKSFVLGQLIGRCSGKRDRECVYRVAKEACIVAQDFEGAVNLRTLQSQNRAKLPKGHRHAPQR